MPMEKRFLCSGAVMVVILLVVSAGCTTSSTGSSASPGTPAQVTAMNTPKTPGQPDYVPSSPSLKTTPANIETLSLQVATPGDTVSVYYTGAFENGTVFDSNMDGTTPTAFTLGNSSVIQGLNDAVTGMSVNQEKTVLIPYDKAYGAYNPALVHTVDRIGPIAGVEFIEGEDYSINDQTTGRYSVVKILHVTPTTVTWDANNPLAGQNLRFTIRLAKIIRP
jgi:peptidylprolyl isomerase